MNDVKGKVVVDDVRPSIPTDPQFNVIRNSMLAEMRSAIVGDLQIEISSGFSSLISLRSCVEDLTFSDPKEDVGYIIHISGQRMRRNVEADQGFAAGVIHADTIGFTVLSTKNDDKKSLERIYTLSRLSAIVTHH